MPLVVIHIVDTSYLRFLPQVFHSVFTDRINVSIKRRRIASNNRGASPRRADARL